MASFNKSISVLLGGGDEAILWSSQGMINLDRYGWNDAISSYMVFYNLLK